MDYLYLKQLAERQKGAEPGSIEQDEVRSELIRLVSGVANRCLSTVYGEENDVTGAVKEMFDAVAPRQEPQKHEATGKRRSGKDATSEKFTEANKAL